jgi:NtrC-family two-component system response regulator AlgB
MAGAIKGRRGEAARADQQTMRILIVDDEPDSRQTLRTALEALGHDVAEADSGADAVRRVEQQACEVVLVDLRPGIEAGLDLIESLRGVHPRLAGVVITANGSIDTAVEAIRRGALDYLIKPFTPAQVRAVVERAVRDRGLRDRVADLEDRVRSELPGLPESTDPRVRRTLDQARVVAASEAPVLIRGESGTGKGVLARAIHAWSHRAGGPLVTVSCPSLGPDQLESDLFGQTRGALTDSGRDVAGKVASAEGGTLFLDEVGGLPEVFQPKLLRFLQEGRYERVGETVTQSADVRVVAATRRDLDAAVASGAFRQDLLYRLNVIELTLPPLRLRSDVGDLADHLLASLARQAGRRLSGFAPEAREALARHRWPGNIRELRNAIERAAILAEGPEVGLHDLPERVARVTVPGGSPVEVGGRVSLGRLEAEHIRRVLISTSSLEEAAEVLGIDPSTLYRKRKRLGL